METRLYDATIAKLAGTKTALGNAGRNFFRGVMALKCTCGIQSLLPSSHREGCAYRDYMARLEREHMPESPS